MSDINIPGAYHSPTEVVNRLNLRKNIKPINMSKIVSRLKEAWDSKKIKIEKARSPKIEFENKGFPKFNPTPPLKIDIPVNPLPTPQADAKKVINAVNSIYNETNQQTNNLLQEVSSLNSKNQSNFRKTKQIQTNTNKKIKAFLEKPKIGENLDLKV
jgi:hypothetical protein